MRKIALALVTVLICVISLGAIAQESPLDEFSECDLTGLSSAIVSSIETAGNDEAKLDAILGEAANAISRVRATCNALTFEGINAKLIGPIDLPEGYYRVRVTTDGYFIAQTTILSGNCDTGRGSLFNLSRGEASDGAEALVTSEGCQLLIETDNISTPWTLVFEPLN